MANEIHITIDVDGAPEAVGKLKQVDTAIDGVTQTSTKAGGAMSDMEKEVRALIDKDLELARVTEQVSVAHTGLRSSLNSAAEGMGITYANLGLLGSATLVASAAMAGWEFGRFIAGLIGSDEAIGNVTAALLHLGDVQAQTAGAHQDVINLAVKRGADAHITYAEALKYNADWFVKWQAQAKETDDAAARMRAPQELAQQLLLWHMEINKVRASGALPALIEGINSHVIGVKELSASYRISEGAINLFKQELADEGRVLKEVDAQILQNWRDEAKAAKEMDDIEIKLHDFALRRFKIETEARQKMTTEINAVVVAGALAIRKVQEDAADALAKTTLSSTDYQIKELWRVVSEEERAFKGSLEQRAIYNKLVEDLAQQQADVLIAKARQTEAELLTIVVGHGPDVPNAGGGGGFSLGGGGLHSLTGAHPLIGFAEGGPVLRDGPIFAHEGEYVVPKGGSGGSAAVTVNVQVSGVFDPSAARTLAKVVKDVFNQEMRQGRLLPAN